ncbi:conserved hypothetical protein [Pyrobaculum islandicum DSM 4184]|uniref:Uncharacterized protein n=1 Tax=Pyrobaculum islandicum (strain DSM 4184 / JCM 9189 / GEO3) TaxID=384616 RepID=A1RQH2_PYRIL|nr:helix-turn-helix domain-containing protein [Pyrobaculum islandicum]ABL87204.1 conserved hypothetical protein [Pyrobaculum islandicum DSM 4184]
MLVILNLTAPPVLILLLPAAMFGNYTLPAPPASDVAAFTPSGAALPTWVVGGNLYILQGGDPAVAIYVPRFENSSGVYKVSLGRGDIIIQAPPGVMIQDVNPLPRQTKLNKTGLYLYLTGPATVTYYFFKVEIKPPPTPPPPTTPATPTATTPPVTTPPATTPPATTPTPQPTPTATATPTPPSGAGAQVPMWLVGVAVVAVAAVAVVAYLLTRRGGGGGDCGDLHETDIAILKELEKRGGSAERGELQEALGLPKTTLHRHLHKLSKYGFVRLVQLGGSQRVELVRGCR